VRALLAGGAATAAAALARRRCNQPGAARSAPPAARPAKLSSPGRAPHDVVRTNVLALSWARARGAQLPVLVSDLDLECRLWLKLRLAPMAPYIGSLSAAFVGPPIIRLQLLPYNRVRIMRIPILQARPPPGLARARRRRGHVEQAGCQGAAGGACAARAGASPGAGARECAAAARQAGRRQGHAQARRRRPAAGALGAAADITLPYPVCAQAFLTKLLTVDLPGLIVLPRRLDVNIPPSVGAVAEAAVGRDAVMRAVASAVLQVPAPAPRRSAPLALRLAGRPRRWGRAMARPGRSARASSLRAACHAQDCQAGGGCIVCVRKLAP